MALHFGQEGLHLLAIHEYAMNQKAVHGRLAMAGVPLGLLELSNGGGAL